MDGEVFEVFNQQHELIGVERRLRVHQTGLLHQAVNVLVFSPAGVLLQKRAASKRVGPSLWDLSCAEHLQPGESFRNAALRGLKEELGLELFDESALQLVRPMQLYRRKYGIDYEDNEFCELYAVTIDQDTEIIVDDLEVAEVAWLDKSFVVQDLLNRPERYTPWLLSEQKYIMT